MAVAWRALPCIDRSAIHTYGKRSKDRVFSMHTTLATSPLSLEFEKVLHTEKFT